MPEIQNLPRPYPLAWPPHRRRTPDAERQRGRYSLKGVGDAVVTLEVEIGRWMKPRSAGRLVNYELTSNHLGRGRDPDDPGAAVWFTLSNNATITGKLSLMVLACDRFRELAQNIRALSLTMERLRLVDEVGAYSLVSAVEGAKALPAPDMPIDWRAELGLGPGFTSLKVVEAVWKAKLQEAGPEHPDHKQLNMAMQAAREELKRDPHGTGGAP